ncbi:MAG: hypothetical protein KGJ13_02415 [Patescibacteria group bacterium]|nr:hypothetical protein [Patescibacteria group bacterium]
MAANIGWVDPNLAAGGSQFAAQSSKNVGVNCKGFAQEWGKLTGDGNGSIYYIAQIPSNAVIMQLQVVNDAAAGMTGCDFGFYNMDGSNPALSSGAAGTYAGNALVANLDLHSASTWNAPVTVVSAAVGLPAITAKRVWELIGIPEQGQNLIRDSYILAMTLNTAGTATPNIGVRCLYIEG